MRADSSLWATARHRLIAGPINPPGHALAQGFVRTLVVVALDPCVHSAFLRPEGACRWAGCIGFENAMHLFVCGVVLRMRSSDKLHCNTQTQPPHAQAREPSAPRPPKGTAFLRGSPWANRSGEKLVSSLDAPPRRSGWAKAPLLSQNG